MLYATVLEISVVAHRPLLDGALERMGFYDLASDQILVSKDTDHFENRSYFVQATTNNPLQIRKKKN
eukprot:scaffold1501_cov130-Cylindrotheca_fusiformis.AAC.13